MVDLGGMGLTLPHDGLGGCMPVGTLSGEAAQLQMEPRIQQIIDVPGVVIKGVGADIAPLYKGRHGDLVEGHLLQHLPKGPHDGLLCV